MGNICVFLQLLLVFSKILLVFRGTHSHRQHKKVPALLPGPGVSVGFSARPGLVLLLAGGKVQNQVVDLLLVPAALLKVQHKPGFLCCPHHCRLRVKS